MTMSNDSSLDGRNRAVAELGAAKLAVKIDGEWIAEHRWYTPDLPVFIADDGSEVDIRDDGSILYETPDGAVQEIEPTDTEDGVASYVPMSIYPADLIEVHRLDEQKSPKTDGDGQAEL